MHNFISFSYLDDQPKSEFDSPFLYRYQPNRGNSFSFKVNDVSTQILNPLSANHQNPICLGLTAYAWQWIGVGTIGAAFLFAGAKTVLITISVASLVFFAKCLVAAVREASSQTDKPIDQKKNRVSSPVGRRVKAQKQIEQIARPRQRHKNLEVRNLDLIQHYLNELNVKEPIVKQNFHNEIQELLKKQRNEKSQPIEMAQRFQIHVDPPTTPPSPVQEIRYPKPIPKREKAPLVVTEPKLLPQYVNDEMAEAEELVEGNRTSLARHFLSGVSNYAMHLKALFYQGQYYTLVSTSQIHLANPNQKFVSVGSSTSREMILLDPNSKVLDQHYQRLLKALEKKHAQINAPLSMLEVLPILVAYIRAEVFPSCTNQNLEYETDQFVQDYKAANPNEFVIHQDSKKKSTKIPAIPLDAFIEKGIGVCRHHGLVAAYFMDRLVREQGGRLIPKGIAQHIRDNIDNGAHVWTTFVEENGNKWHIDTLWNRCRDLNDPSQVKRLKELYGESAIENEQKKLQIAVSYLKKKQSQQSVKS